MNKDKLIKMINEKKKKVKELITRGEKSNDVNELRNINNEIENIRADIEEIESSFEEDTEGLEGQRSNKPVGELSPLASYGFASTGKRSDGAEEVINKVFKATNNLEDVALRKGESFSSKINLAKEERNLDIGKYVKGIVTGDWTGAEKEKRALVTTGTGMNLIIPQEMASNIIDVARDLSIFSFADVPVVPMNSNNLTISRIKKDPEFKFKAEAEKSTEVPLFELEPITLKSKTCYGYGYISLEAIWSSVNLSSIVQHSFAEAMAAAIDKAMLYGQYNGTSYDEFAPKGIMNDPLITKVQATEGEGYDSFIKAMSKIKKANGIPQFYAINAETDEKLSLLKDTQGRYLEPPISFKELPGIVSNQLKYDVSAGSDALVFDPKSMIIGIQKRMTIEFFSKTDKCIENGLVGYRIYSMLDCAIVKPNNICKITGIK